MQLNDFHDIVRYFVNKEQGGWLSPEEIDNLTHRAQMAWYATCLNIYGKNQKSTDPLNVFSEKLPFTTASDGKVSLPKTEGVDPYFESLLSVSVSYYDGTKNRFKPVKMLSEDEISERLDSQILAPTSTDPVGMESADSIQLYPQVSLTGYVYYLRRPKKPVFAYAQTGRTITYNPSTSVQLEWAETSINKILMKTINMFGVNLSDELVLQYSELKQNQDI
jgi:hypothetical protein